MSNVIALPTSPTTRVPAASVGRLIAQPDETRRVDAAATNRQRGGGADCGQLRWTQHLDLEIRTPGATTSARLANSSGVSVEAGSLARSRARLTPEPQRSHVSVLVQSPPWIFSLMTNCTDSTARPFADSGAASPR